MSKSINKRMAIRLPKVMLFLRFIIAVFLPPLLTFFWVCLFEWLEKHGYHTDLPKFSDQEFLEKSLFFIKMLFWGVGISMLSGFILFLCYELYLLRQHKITKRQAHVIAQLSGILVYIVTILLASGIYFLHPVYFLPVMITIGITTSVYLGIYSINHVFRSPCNLD